MATLYIANNTFETLWKTKQNTQTHNITIHNNHKHITMVISNMTNQNNTSEHKTPLQTNIIHTNSTNK